MSSSSSDESSAVLGFRSASSGLSSTASLLFSHPSESSDVQTEITPPNSPAGDEVLKRLATRNRLAQVRGRVSQPEATPSRATKIRPLLPSSSLSYDESGYESDGDVRGSALGRLTSGDRRPRMTRVDPRQGKRVPSSLSKAPAVTTSSGDEVSPDLWVDTSTENLSSRNHAFPPSASLTLIVGYAPERRTRKAAIGLGLGLPPNHPLRTRAFTMPMLSPTSSTESSSPAEEGKLLPYRPFPPIPDSEPPKLSIKPTTLNTIPSPIDLLPPSMMCYCAEGGTPFSSLDSETEHVFTLGGRVLPSTMSQLKDDTTSRYATASPPVVTMP